MSLVLFAATTNPGKLRDFSAAATESGIHIEQLSRLREIVAPEEDEPSFEGNARLKAVYYSRFAPGMLVLADDSGLEVDALEGGPGVRSARYALDAGYSPAGIASADERNNLYLLERMKGVGLGGRSARYRCVLALARDGKCLGTSVGSVEGDITETPRGSGGFGYDPLFWLPELKKTMAEIDVAARNEFSHRGRAFRHMVQQWLQGKEILLQEKDQRA